MSETMYKQCELTRQIPAGLVREVAWIPSRYAIAGKSLQIKNGQQWEDNWRVENVTEPELPGSLLNERSQDYKNQREASDIPRGSRLVEK